MAFDMKFQTDYFTTPQQHDISNGVTQSI